MRTIARARPAELKVEIWMRLTNHELLRETLEQRGVSVRTASVVAGYKSHSHLAAALRGEPAHLGFELKPAMKLCKFLGVPLRTFFTDTASRVDTRNDAQIGTPIRRQTRRAA